MNRKMHIVIGLDETYHRKTEILYDSLKHNAKGFSIKILCLGFRPVDCRPGWEYKTAIFKRLKSYRTDFPENRKFYVCVEGGEFLSYFQFDDEDIIIHIDSDMIMQRPFNEQEIAQIQNLKYMEVAGSYSSIPHTTLREEFWKLKPKIGYEKAKKLFPGFWNEGIFCAGVVVCTAKTYRDLISMYYLGNIENMIYTFGHHAAGQWLMNYAVFRYGSGFINLGHAFHNASWFIDTGVYEENNQLMWNNQVVLFNHTKYLKNYDYK